MCLYWMEVMGSPDVAKALQVLGQSSSTHLTVMGHSLGTHWALFLVREQTTVLIMLSAERVNYMCLKSV